MGMIRKVSTLLVTWVVTHLYVRLSPSGANNLLLVGSSSFANHPLTFLINLQCDCDIAAPSRHPDCHINHPPAHCGYTAHEPRDEKIRKGLSFKEGCLTILLVPSPFFPGILLSRKPPELQEKQLVKNDWKEWGTSALQVPSLFDTNGESTARTMDSAHANTRPLSVSHPSAEVVTGSRQVFQQAEAQRRVERAHRSGSCGSKRLGSHLG